MCDLVLKEEIMCDRALAQWLMMSVQSEVWTSAPVSLMFNV